MVGACQRDSEFRVALYYNAALATVFSVSEEKKPLNYHIITTPNNSIFVLTDRSRGFSGRDAERSDRSLCPIKLRDARVASPNNTQGATCSSHDLENTHIPPRRSRHALPEKKESF